jgi:3-hydroxybutyrate dehydrogenase
MLKGRSAIVTGSTSGIGLGIAETLAAEGVNILFNGFGDKAAIDAVVSGTASKFGVKTAYSAADMSKAAEIRAMVKQAEDTFGAVDILINNAGIQFTSTIEEFPEEKWDAIIAINLTSAFHAMKAAIPGMKKRNWGRIRVAAKISVPIR